MTVTLLLTFALVSAYRLGFYLTGSAPCAAVAAFVFATSPHLAVDRDMLGYYSEYFAFCLLPAALYWNLRAISLKSFRRWALAVIFTGALILSHLITGFFFLFFYALFFILAAARFPLRELISHRGSGHGLARPEMTGKKNHPVMSGRHSRARRGKAYFRKAVTALSVAVAALLLCAYYLGPAILYGDLVIKKLLLTEMKTGFSHSFTQLLTVLSFADLPWSWQAQLRGSSFKFQAGLLVFASHVAFACYCAKARSTWALPFALTSWTIFVFVVRPQVFFWPLLREVDIAQFPFRFLIFFTLAGTVSCSVALRTIFSLSNGLSAGGRAAVALALVGLTLALSGPYLYPRFVGDDAVLTISADDIRSSGALQHNEDAYLRPVPPMGSIAWVNPERKAIQGAGRADDRKFTTDLAEYCLSSGGPPGEILLDILYFPGLQEVETNVFHPAKRAGTGAEEFNLDTYWQRRETVTSHGVEGPGAFHGLRLTGFPCQGRLEARVKFVGMRWANRLSMAACAALIAAAAIRGVWHLNRPRRVRVLPSF
ncbi:MAG: hypothetical protein LBW85_03805 [Deltaproteobacteria bacterium]|nr:hypothetical protein [Deltaproteobacteria bacterium]